MMRILLLVFLCFALAVRADDDRKDRHEEEGGIARLLNDLLENDLDAEDYCKATGALGGWSAVDVHEEGGNAEDSITQLDEYITLSTEEFIASSNGTFACPDDYISEAVAACRQIVNGVNYKILSWSYCVLTDEAYLLSSDIYVPAGSDSSGAQVTSVDLLLETTFDEAFAAAVDDHEHD